MSVRAVELGAEMEPLVKPTITSDVQAGCDLLRGAALAALRTADINLVSLEQRAHPQAAEIRQRRDSVYRAAVKG
jgi:formiminotetrahydrofolate cyclodeaminase